MRRCQATEGALALFFSALIGLRAQESWNTIEDNARSAIVRVRVVGKIDGNITTEIGTGFLITSKDGPRVITAGHVVGPDSKWDDVPPRDIFIKQMGLGSSIEVDPLTDATVERDVDIAQIPMQPYNPATLTIAATQIGSGSKLDVGSWAKADRIAKFQVVDLLSFRDPDRLHLSGNYEPSHSGSPVIDNLGHVVGMVVERVETIDSPQRTIGLALPGSILNQVLDNRRAQLPLSDNPVRSAQLGGCVFLGKQSAIGAASSKDAPFGADFLISVRAPEKRPSLIEKPLRVVSRSELRSRCPVIIDDIAYYGRVIAQLFPGDSLVINSINEMNYAEDTFYWAGVDHVIPAGSPTDRGNDLIALSQDPKN
jgi:hypothetical protein